MSEHDPQLSVVIPNWDGASLLECCLKSVFKNGADLEIEVVVFDNGSRDGSVDVARGFARKHPIRVLRSEQNIGFAAACNACVKASKAPYILLLNNDAEVLSELRIGVDYLRHNDSVGACQGPLLMADGQHVDSAGSLLARSGFLQHVGLGETLSGLPPAMEAFSVKGAAMWIRRSALAGRPPFDDDAFAYFEESDLCWRLAVEGWSIRYDQRLPAVRHQVGMTSRRLPPEVCQFHSFKNRLRSVLRYTELRTAVTMIPRHLLWCAVLGIGLLIQGRRRESLAVARALIWNGRRLPLTIRERKQVRLRRRTDDLQLLDRVGGELSIWGLRKQVIAGDRAEVIARADGSESGSRMIESVGAVNAAQ